jgi:RNA polymerase sigma factor (sigma-70 family)
MGQQQSLGLVVRHLRDLASCAGIGALSDAQLLERFVARREEAAFTVLLQRHGTMVLGVCRRVLGQAQDAEDAFQATFLALVRQARSVGERGSVGGWLYRVACRIAMKAKVNDHKRKVSERRGANVSGQDARPRNRQTSNGNEVQTTAIWEDLRLILDEELERLPEKLRLPVVFCYLEGKTYSQTAQELGWSKGTVSGRLAQARELLRQRLSRRGVLLSSALLVTLLSAEAAAAAVPYRLAAETGRAALMWLSGSALGDAVSTRVLTLLQGATHTIALGKLKLGVILVLLTALLAAGAGAVAYQPERQDPEAARGELPAVLNVKPPAPEDGIRTDQFGDPLPAGALKRIGTLRFRQGGGTINSLLVCPDGKTLVSKAFYGNRTICAWELATGKLLHQFPGHYEENGAVALTPDGKEVAIGKDYLIRFYDLSSGREVRQLRAPLSEVQGLAISRDGTMLASGHARSTVILWDLAAGTTLAQIPAQHNRLTRMAFTLDGKTLVTGDCFDPRIRLFDVSSRKQRHEIIRRNVPPNIAREFALSPDGSLLAVGPGSIWNVKTGRLVRESHGAPIVANLAFAPDGKTLASAERNLKGSRNVIVLSDVATGKRLRTLTEDTGPGWAITFTPDGKTLIAGSGSSIRLWDVATGKESGPSVGTPWFVGSLALAPDGSLLAYKADTGLRFCGPATDERGKLPGEPWSLAFSPDGKILAAGGMELNKVDLLDVTSRRLARRLDFDPRKNGFVSIGHYRVAFSPNGKLLATGGPALRTGGGSEAVVQLWDVASGKPGRRFTMEDQPDEICQIEAVAFAPDGKTVAASAFTGYTTNSDGSKVRVWEVASGRTLTNLSAALSESPDKLPEQPPWHYVRIPTILPRLVFSPDGKMIALNRLEKTILIRETATGKVRLRLAGHEDSTVCVAFAPDGRTLASASWDNTIRLWDLGSGKELLQLTGHRGPVDSLVFAPDGRTLISAGADTTIVYWDVAGVTQRPPQSATPPSEQEWETLWTQLASADSARAYEAMQRLTAVVPMTVDGLKLRLRPSAAGEPPRLGRLLTDLDSKQFAVRERASQELEKQAETVEPELRRALARPGTSPEVRRRLEQLLDKTQLPSGRRLQELRALEMLEHIATPEAQGILQTLAKGEAESRLTQEAKAAAERLVKRYANRRQ